MRDPNRLYSFYEELRRIHMEHFPELRFGQFIDNFRYWLSDKKGVDIFWPEETALLNYLREYTGE